MTDRAYRSVLTVSAIASLTVCLAAPVLFFLGRVTERTFKSVFLLASVAWFVLATARSAAKASAGKGPGRG